MNTFSEGYPGQEDEDSGMSLMPAPAQQGAAPTSTPWTETQAPSESLVPTGEGFNSAGAQSLPDSAAVQNYKRTGVTPIEASELLHRSAKIRGGPLGDLRKEIRAGAQDYGQLQSDIEGLGSSAIQDRIKIGQQENDALKPLYDEQTKLSEQYAAANDALLAKQTQVLEQKQHMNQTINDLANEKIVNPMATASLPVKLSALLAVALGGFAQGFGKLANNTPLDIINQAVDQDIQLQKFNLENRRNTAQMKGGILEQNFRMYGDMRVATAATKTAYMDALGKRMESTIAQFSNPKAVAAGKEALAQLLQKSADARNVVLQHSQSQDASIAMNQEALNQQREVMEANQANASKESVKEDFTAEGFELGGRIYDQKARLDTNTAVDKLDALTRDLVKLKKLGARIQKDNALTNIKDVAAQSKIPGVGSLGAFKSADVAAFDSIRSGLTQTLHLAVNPEISFTTEMNPKYEAQIPTLQQALISPQAFDKMIREAALGATEQVLRKVKTNAGVTPKKDYKVFQRLRELGVKYE